MKINWKSKTVIIPAVIVFVLIFLSAKYFGNGGDEFYSVSEQDFTRTVVVSGKVVPSDEVDMSFDVAGRVNVVGVNIGDRVRRGQVLASLDGAEIYSEIKQLQADLQSEQAKLNSLVGQNSSDSQLLSKKEELLNVYKKSHVTANDVLSNKIDSFFDDPDSRYPEFYVILLDYYKRREINDTRYQIGLEFDDWMIDVNNINIGNVDVSTAQVFIKHLESVEYLLSLVSSASSEFEAGGDVTQSQIDAYISSISSARTSISSMIVEINQTVEAFLDVQADLPVQQAAVSSAESNLAKVTAKSAKYALVAPFDGVVTARNIEPGETAEVGKIAISMIGDTGLELETFIPEVRITGVDENDFANIKLDAFGADTILKAVITHIDPRETIKEGITTYKTILNFMMEYPEVRPGMTADIEIEKDRKDNVVLIPTHLIMEDEEGKYVKVLRGDIVRQSVVLGDYDEKGSVIVTEGVSVGDMILIPKE